MLVAFSSASNAIKCYDHYNIKVGKETKTDELKVEDCVVKYGILYNKCFSLKGSIIRDGVNYEVVDIRSCATENTCNYYKGIGNYDKESKRLENIIKNYLGYNKWEVGKAELESTPISASCCDDKNQCNVGLSTTTQADTTTAATTTTAPTVDSSSSGGINSFMTSLACLAVATFA